jgi:hypothetical protein
MMGFSFFYIVCYFIEHIKILSNSTNNTHLKSHMLETTDRKNEYMWISKII